MRKAFSLLLAVGMVLMLLMSPALAVEPDPSVESAIAAAEAAAARKASEEQYGITSPAAAEPAAEASDEAAEEASDEASGEASGEGLSAGTGELINVLSSAIVLPLCFLSIILWFFRAYGQALENKNNGWLKVHKVLRKIHIPVGAATVIIGTYHAVFASIKHGWSLNWGMAAMILFLLGFVTWLFRKQLKRRWIVLHRFTTLLATICMMIHAAPYLQVVFVYIVPMMLRQLF